MIDTHCHLTDPRLGDQLAGVLARAAANDVRRMITISTDLADAGRCIALAARHPDRLRCTVGIHPNHAHEADLSQLPTLRALQANSSVVALGEMGLDYHYGLRNKQRQTEVFQQQLQIAADAGRPVVIHCREAIDDCLAMLRAFPAVAALFHCFTGTAAEARRVLDSGHHLGFTGVITYKSADEQREAVRLTPPDRLVIETDSPYLAPEPHRRQKINEPALVIFVADVVGRVKGWDRAEVDRVTSENAGRFFGWP